MCRVRYLMNRPGCLAGGSGCRLSGPKVNPVYRGMGQSHSPGAYPWGGSPSKLLAS